MNSVSVPITSSPRAATPAITDEYSLIDQPVGELIDQAIVGLSNTRLFQGQLGHHLVRAAMVLTFAIFGYQKWFSFELHQIRPLIEHSPLVFWLIPAFGLRGAGFFLGTTEWLFGSLILLGFWNRKLGALGALGSIVTFLGTVSIIPFLPDAWAAEAGGFPLMYLPVAFLMKDVLFLAVSVYLAQHDVREAAREIGQGTR
jgi:uncharacterized membrane protein YkgB